MKTFLEKEKTLPSGIFSLSDNVFLVIKEKVRQSTCLYHTIPTERPSGKKAVENIVRKGENAGDQHFLLFQQCFLSLSKTNFIFVPNNLNLKQPWGKKAFKNICGKRIKWW